MERSGCSALKLEDEPICCAVSISHRFAFKDKIGISDLYGENVMLIRRGWNSRTDAIRDEIWSAHPQIKLMDIPFFNVDAFNKCESSNAVLIGF